MLTHMKCRTATAACGRQAELTVQEEVLNLQNKYRPEEGRYHTCLLCNASEVGQNAALASTDNLTSLVAYGGLREACTQKGAPFTGPNRLS